MGDSLNEEQLYHFTLQKISEAVIWLDIKGRIYNANEAACQFLGYERDTLLSKTIFDINKTFNQVLWEKQWTKLKKEGQFTIKTEATLASGKRTSVRILRNMFSLNNRDISCSIILDLSAEDEFINLLKQLTEGTQSFIGNDFFLNLSLSIAQNMGVDYVLISKCINQEKTKVKTLSYTTSKEVLENFEYDLSDTPCKIVMEGEPYHCEKGLENKFIKEEGVQGYYGVPVFDSNGEILGHIAVLNKKPLKLTESQKEILKIYSNRLGAEITRKVYEEELLKLNKNLSELKNQLQKENIYLKEEISEVYNFNEIVTNSAKFRKTLGELKTVAKTNATVLVQGETGTGKELIARAVHNQSNRKKHALVKVNCAALPAQLIESELFGHKKGAFTGAISDKKGKFEIADKGTIFLDEIGELPLELQPKLLRVLQEGEIERVGDNKPIKVDVRVIAATNRNLQKEVQENRFRNDLFFRLNVFPINCLPLRERKEDIEILVKHFVRKFAKQIGTEIDSIDKKALKKLEEYNWPGNIRELENVIERSVILNTGSVLNIPIEFESSESPDQNWNMAIIEKKHILKALEHCGWKVSGKNGTAELLGLKATTLEARMKKLDISRS
jgi:PAS domain S-box-containing protein